MIKMQFMTNPYVNAGILLVAVVLGVLVYVQKIQIDKLTKTLVTLSETNRNLQNDRDQIEVKISKPTTSTATPEKYVKHPLEISESLENEYSSQTTEIKESSQQDSQDSIQSDVVGNDRAVFSERMLNEPDYDPINAIQNKFAREVTDENWATQYETHLIELFYSEALLANSNLHEVTCKTSICELQVYSNEGAIEVGTLLAKTLATQSWRDQEASFSFNNIKNGDMLTFYIGRDKNSLFTD
jgi:hypothetical protein